MARQGGGLNGHSPLAAVSWSDGALQNIKFQALSLRVSGVRKKKHKS
jgi:hypothetical protein